jgi:hypothetical protein
MCLNTSPHLRPANEIFEELNPCIVCTESKADLRGEIPKTNEIKNSQLYA